MERRTELGMFPSRNLQPLTAIFFSGGHAAGNVRGPSFKKKTPKSFCHVFLPSIAMESWMHRPTKGDRWIDGLGQKKSFLQQYDVFQALFLVFIFLIVFLYVLNIEKMINGMHNEVQDFRKDFEKLII